MWACIHVCIKQLLFTVHLKINDNVSLLDSLHKLMIVDVSEIMVNQHDSIGSLGKKQLGTIVAHLYLCLSFLELPVEKLVKTVFAGLIYEYLQSTLLLKKQNSL